MEKQRFKIHLGKRLGQGEEGSVHPARLTDASDPTDWPFVAKIFAPLRNERTRKCYERELHVLRTLARAKASHPCLVAYVGHMEDCDKDDGRGIIFMARGPSTPLETFVTDEPWPAEAAMHVFRQLAGAVAHLHAHGIAHRDIKPQNILYDMTAQALVLIDLGYATDVRGPAFLGRPYYGHACSMCGKHSLVTTLEMRETYCRDCGFGEIICSDWVGSPLYMAPEVLNTKPYSALRADVFGVGLVLCLIFFGTRGVPGFDDGITSASELRAARGIRGIPIPYGHPGVGTDLEFWLRQAVDTNASNRPMLHKLFQSER